MQQLQVVLLLPVVEKMRKVVVKTRRVVKMQKVIKKVPQEKVAKKEGRKQLKHLWNVRIIVSCIFLTMYK
jgi:hypothetical protein